MNFEFIIEWKEILRPKIEKKKPKNPIKYTSNWMRRQKQCLFAYLSSDMLQLICVFLCVLTVIKGNWIAEFCDGTRPRSSASLLRVTKLLNETCCKMSSRNCCCLFSIRSRRISISASKALHCYLDREPKRMSLFCVLQKWILQHAIVVTYLCRICG